MIRLKFLSFVNAVHIINIVCLPANSTHFLQPLDVAFFRPLKQRWRKVLDDYKSSRGKKASTLSKEVFPRLLKNLQGAVYLGEDNHNDNLFNTRAPSSLHEVTFPGNLEGARVSTLKKCKHVGWNWPAFKYEIDYDWKDIVKKNVKAIPVNNRGQFLFPDLEEEWGK